MGIRNPRPKEEDFREACRDRHRPPLGAVREALVPIGKKLHVYVIFHNKFEMCGCVSVRERESEIELVKIKKKMLKTEKGCSNESG